MDAGTGESIVGWLPTKCSLLPPSWSDLGLKKNRQILLEYKNILLFEKHEDIG